MTDIVLLLVFLQFINMTLVILCMILLVKKANPKCEPTEEETREEKEEEKVETKKPKSVFNSLPKADRTRE